MKERILQLRKEGKSYLQIQKEIGCSLSTISWHLSPACRKKAKARFVRNVREGYRKLKEKYGSKCMICGYSKCMAALDFHHLQEDDKIRNVSQMSYLAAAKEAKKCVLICANCHREVHNGVTEISHELRQPLPK